VANKEQIKSAILKVAGNPETGIVNDLVDSWADAIVAIDQPEAASLSKPAKETRVVTANEVR
jgi:hypothetical protein